MNETEDIGTFGAGLAPLKCTCGSYRVVNRTQTWEEPICGTCLRQGKTAAIKAEPAAPAEPSKEKLVKKRPGRPPKAKPAPAAPAAPAPVAPAAETNREKWARIAREPAPKSLQDQVHALKSELDARPVVGDPVTPLRLAVASLLGVPATTPDVELIRDLQEEVLLLRQRCAEADEEKRGSIEQWVEGQDDARLLIRDGIEAARIWEAPNGGYRCKVWTPLGEFVSRDMASLEAAKARVIEVLNGAQWGRA